MVFTVVTGRGVLMRTFTTFSQTLNSRYVRNVFFISGNGRNVIRSICRISSDRNYTLTPKKGCGLIVLSSRSVVTSNILSDPQPQKQQLQSLPEDIIEPSTLTADDLRTMYTSIHQSLSPKAPELSELSNYYFDGHGKALRPMLVTLVAKAVNSHVHGIDGTVTESQLKVAHIAEMIHTASLVHDDVIDMSDMRRGKTSVNCIWGQRKAILAGDYILAIGSYMASRIGNTEVIIALAQTMSDLVHGEFMQLKNKANDERFSHYLEKCYFKTASLMAHTCKAAAALSGADNTICEHAYQYGRHIGIAFQLVDDLIDFISSQSVTGKPAVADLKLGLATAPVLFASKQFPDLVPLIDRRFSEPGDVEKAINYVQKSEGLDQTRYLAQQHCMQAIDQVNQLRKSPEQKALVTMTHKVLNRLK